MCAQTVLVLLNLHFCMQKKIGRVKFSAEKPFAIPFVWRPAALSPMAALCRSLTDTSSSSLAY